MLKSSRTLWMCAAILVIASLVLTACGGGAAPATTAPQPAQPTQAPADKPTEAPKPTAAPTEKPAEAATPVEKPTEAAPAGAFVSRPSDKVTSSGFVCPEPQADLDVTSTELNLFVWTEYIPKHSTAP